MGEKRSYKDSKMYLILCGSSDHSITVVGILCQRG